MTQTAGRNAAFDKPLNAFMIETGHELAVMLVMGAILGGWR